jgi:uncharacterized membrane protein
VTGPVQVLVVGFEQPRFSGEVLAELARLREAGIVRLLDLLVVSRGEDGSLDTVTPPGDLPEDTGRLAAALLGSPEGSTDGLASSAGIDDQARWSLADAIPIGTTAAVALIEHTWAEPLREAVNRSGGVPLDETWLAREDADLLDTLLAGQAKG